MRPLTSPVRRVAHRYYRAGEVAGVIGHIILKSLINIALAIIIGIGIMVLFNGISIEQIPNIFKFIGQDPAGRDSKRSEINKSYYQEGVPYEGEE